MNDAVTKLKDMKNALGLSNKELSDMSNVPIGTVNRVLAGRVEAPNFQTIRDMVQAMGGSMDEVCGITVAAKEQPAAAEQAEQLEQPEQPEQIEQPEQMEQPKQADSQPENPTVGISPDAIHAFTVLLEEKQKELDSKERWLKKMFGACCVLVGIIVVILIIDLLNPSIGFFVR